MADVLRCARADATWPFRRLLRSLRFCLQPFEPIARSNVYFIVSPTASGPLIAAVAISGYCMERTPLTSSTVILLSGSCSLIPRNENSRRIALACMAYLLLLLLFFLSPRRERCRLILSW